MQLATCYPRDGNSSLFKAKLSPLLSLSARPPNPPRPLPRPPRPPLSPLPPRPPRPLLRVSVEPLNSIRMSTICFTRPDVLIFSSMTLKEQNVNQVQGCAIRQIIEGLQPPTEHRVALPSEPVKSRVPRHKICTKNVSFPSHPGVFILLSKCGFHPFHYTQNFVYFAENLSTGSHLLCK